MTPPAADPRTTRRASLLALGAIALWGSLAPLGVSLAQVPPFLLTGLGLLAGSVLGLGFALWGRVSLALPWRTLALGVYGLFGFHFLLFIALRHAPPVQANLVNYLWPLGIVLLAPVLLPGARLRPLHVVAALIGFGGAALAILGGAADTGGPADAGGLQWGYVAAKSTLALQLILSFTRSPSFIVSQNHCAEGGRD